ncbi:MAG: RHS repeat-associated core domain-containing protein [Dehalococcoidia bacterium]
MTTTFAYRGDGLCDSRISGATTFTWDRQSPRSSSSRRGLPVVLDDGALYLYGGAGLEAMRAGGNDYYYLADGLGSTMAIVDAAGVVSKTYTYDVYGKPTATGTLANSYDFAGQETDATGLQYLRARYMDPETGTFVSREPLAMAPWWLGNPTQYAAASPAGLVDPTGTRFCDATDCEEGERVDRGSCHYDEDGNYWANGCFIYHDGQWWACLSDDPNTFFHGTCEQYDPADVDYGGCSFCAGVVSRLALLDEYGAVIGTVTFSGGLDRAGRPHWSRHLEDAGITRGTAERAIGQDLARRIARGELGQGGNNFDVLIDGRLVRYTAYLDKAGNINVGRAVFPP